MTRISCARDRLAASKTRRRETGHDLKFDALVLARQGIDLRGLAFDSMLASYLLDATRLGPPARGGRARAPRLQGADRGGRLRAAAPRPSLPGLSPGAAPNYAGERADLAGSCRTLAPLLVTDHLEPVYRELEMPLIPVLADIERAGIRVDERRWHASRDTSNRSSPATPRGSSSSPARSSTSTRRSSSAHPVREAAAAGGQEDREDAIGVDGRRSPRGAALTHELPRLVLEWRALHKLKSTYIDALPLMVHPETGRVHTCFNQAVAATGRLSSSDPNLQNIPIRTELGREIRRAFVAAPGSRADLRRLLADRAARARAHGRRGGADRGVPNRRGHPRSHGGEVFGTDQRARQARAAQPVEDGQLRVLYGKTPFTLAQETSTSRRKPRRSSSTPTSPAFPAFARSSIARSKRRGRPASSGRCSAAAADAEPDQPQLPDARAGRTRGRQHADPGHRGGHPEEGDDRSARGASTARPRARMILTVHDELLFESPARGSRRRRGRPRAHGERGGAERAAHGGRRHRPRTGGTRNRKGRLDRLQAGLWITSIAALPAPTRSQRCHRVLRLARRACATARESGLRHQSIEIVAKFSVVSGDNVERTHAAIAKFHADRCLRRRVRDTASQ